MDILKKFSFLGSSLSIASLGAGIFEGMDYERYKVQLITATKDTQKASQLMRETIAFANKTPFETGQIIEATAKFESMGLYSKKWLGITADMAGATSKDMIQGVEATTVIVLIMILIKNWDKVKIVVLKFWKVIKTICSNIVVAFTGAFKAIVSLIIKFVNLIITTISNIFNGIINFITGVFTGNWEQALNGLKSIAEGIFNIIKGIFLAPFRFFAKGINWVIEKINSLKIDIPNWVPVIGGNSYSLSIPTIPTDIPNFATGTSYHRGGLARINEGGRGEIVDLPNGSKVIPADKSEKLLDKNNNNTINVTVNVYNPNDVDEIVKVIAYKLKQVLDNI